MVHEILRDIVSELDLLEAVLKLMYLMKKRPEFYKIINKSIDSQNKMKKLFFFKLEGWYLFANT